MRSRPSVGASLLAKAVYQSPFVVAELTTSRAGSLSPCFVRLLIQQRMQLNELLGQLVPGVQVDQRHVRLV